MGGKQASPLSDAPSWIPDIRLTAGVGRQRKGGFRSRSTEKLTLWLPDALAAIDPSRTLVSRCGGGRFVK